MQTWLRISHALYGKQECPCTGCHVVIGASHGADSDAPRSSMADVRAQGVSRARSVTTAITYNSESHINQRISMQQAISNRRSIYHSKYVVASALSIIPRWHTSAIAQSSIASAHANIMCTDLDESWEHSPRDAGYAHVMLRHSNGSKKTQVVANVGLCGCSHVGSRSCIC